MKRFVEGTGRGQSALFPECLEDWIGEDNPVRVIDVFVEVLDLAKLGFGVVDPEATGRPSYHPASTQDVCQMAHCVSSESGHRLCTAAMVLMPVSAPIKVLV